MFSWNAADYSQAQTIVLAVSAVVFVVSLAYWYVPSHVIGPFLTLLARKFPDSESEQA